MSNGLTLTEFFRVVGTIIKGGPTLIANTVVPMARIARERKISHSTLFVIAYIRLYLLNAKPDNIHTIFPSGDIAYQRWITKMRKMNPKDPFIKSNIEICSTDLPKTGGTLHWLGTGPNGPSGDSKVVMLCHGGGYILALNNSHVAWAYEHVRTAREAGIKLCVAILQYTLIPVKAYPTQLRQASEGLSYILGLGIKPSNIVIGGDSAGGNLIFGLLGHILHPHPDIDPICLSQPLAGAFGISPWISMKTDTPSYHQNDDLDAICAYLIDLVGSYLYCDTTREAELANKQYWAMPHEAPIAWWSDLSSAVSRVLLTTGKEEVFRDHILEFADVLKSIKYGPQLLLDVGDKEIHDQILFDFVKEEVFRLKHESRLARLLMDWTNNTWTADTNQSQ